MATICRLITDNGRTNVAKHTVRYANERAFKVKRCQDLRDFCYEMEF